MKCPRCHKYGLSNYGEICSKCELKEYEKEEYAKDTRIKTLIRKLNNPDKETYNFD